MSNVPVKNQVTVKKSLLSFIQQFFPEQEHLYSLDDDSDSVNVIRYFASQRPKHLVWRDLRPYMLADDVESLADNEVRRLVGGGIQEGVLNGCAFVYIGNWAVKSDRVCSRKSIQCKSTGTSSELWRLSDTTNHLRRHPTKSRHYARRCYYFGYPITRRARRSSG